MFKYISCLAGCALLAVLLVGLFGADYTRSQSEGRYYSYRQSSGESAAEAGKLRVVMPYEKRELRAASPFGPGLDEELLSMFLEETGQEAHIYYVRTYQQALDMLESGRFDLAVGFSGQLNEAREDDLDQGPVYATFYPVLVKSGSGDAKIFSNVLSSGLRSKPASIDGGGDYLLNPNTYAILVPLLQDIRTKSWLKEPVGYRWFWNAENAKLGQEMTAFWKDQEKSLALSEMRERYYGFMPETIGQADLLHLAQVVNSRMGRYSDAINKAAEATGVDPLLLAAIIFQESRFDPDAVSYTGVRGIMQITSETAKMLKINRLDPEECIMGGARYLSEIKRGLDGLDISEWDRWCLALAGYNQGPGALRVALKTADAKGVGKNWASMREVYASMRLPGGNSGFRPQEALQYVENVRYYYYVMSRLAALAAPDGTGSGAGGEGQNFAPLVTLSANP